MASAAAAGAKLQVGRHNLVCACMPDTELLQPNTWLACAPHMCN